MAQLSKHFDQLPASLQNLVRFLVNNGSAHKVVLFGSRARGDARENSDYDFAIWVKNREQWTKAQAQLDQVNLTLLPVDLVLYDEVSADYRSNIDREGVVIYG